MPLDKQKPHGLTPGYLIRLRKVLACLFGLGLFAAMATGGEHGPIVIVELPPEPLQAEAAAAEEIRMHLEKIYGPDAVLITHGKAAGADFISAEWRIRLGRAAFLHPGSNGLLLDGLVGTGKGTIDIAGVDAGRGKAAPSASPGAQAGTLWATQWFLREQLGFEWIWPGDLGLVVPESADPLSELQPGLFLVARPVRQVRWLARPGDPSKRSQTQRWAQRHGLHGHRGYPMGHGLKGTWARYGEAHREWFQRLPDGTRGPDPLFDGGRASRVTHCVSNPRLHEAIVGEWAGERDKLRDPQWLNAGEVDAAGRCTCISCRLWDEGRPLAIPGAVMARTRATEVSLAKARQVYAAGDVHWYRYLGTLADRYARFALALLRKAQQIDANARVSYLAYANYKEPPVAVELPPEVFAVVVAPIMFPWTEARQQGADGIWNGWTRSGANLGYWANWPLDGHALALEYSQEANAHLRPIVEERPAAVLLNAFGGQWAAMGLNAYTTARTLSTGSIAPELAERSYCKAFGPAAGAVRSYLHWWRYVSRQYTEELPDIAWLNLFRRAPEIHPPWAMEGAAHFLARAEAAVAADGRPSHRQRVAALRAAYGHLEHVLAVEHAFREKGGDGSALAEHPAWIALHRYREEHHDAMGFPTALWERFERQHWNLPAHAHHGSSE